MPRLSGSRRCSGAHAHMGSLKSGYDVSRSIAFSLRCYRLFLYIYPAPFRLWFAKEMAQVFRERCLDAHRRLGTVGLILLWLETAASAVIEAPKEHYHMLLHDIRYSLRTLVRTPGLTAICLICLTLGLGASTAIFSIVNTVLLRPLPYRDAKQLALVYTEFPTFPNGGLHKFYADPPEFHELQTRK